MSGLALFFSGSRYKYEENATRVYGPVNTSMCDFERNNAGDGGAIYSNAGYDNITHSRFKGNVAGIAPGEMVLLRARWLPMPNRELALHSCSSASRLSRSVCSASLPPTLETEQRRE